MVGGEDPRKRMAKEMLRTPRMLRPKVKPEGESGGTISLQRTTSAV